MRTPDETDEFNDRLELHRPDGTSVWSGWGTDVMSASETEIVLHQQWTGSMGGPIDVDKKLVLRNGVFVEVEGLKPSDVDR